MDDDLAGYYRHKRERNRLHRAEQRAINTPRIVREAEAAGALVEVKNHGAHVVIRKGSTRWDYWPGTAKWVRDLDHGKARSGRKRLVRDIRETG